MFQVIVKSLYSCVSLLQQQFMLSVGETTIFCTFYVYYTSSSFNFILVVTSVITVLCVVVVTSVVTVSWVVVVDAVAVVAVVAVVSVATVGISIVMSSAITAKLDKWLDKHLTVVELTKISVSIPFLDQLVRVSVLQI